jgi:D-alanyl-D-alanine carboxypeptidase (penicillin-binding protein 5/6)
MSLTTTPFRLFALLVVLFLAWMPAAQAIDLPTPPQVAARAWLLMDTQSGQIVQGQAVDERVEPASLTKLMTAYVVFAAIKEKRISLTQTAPVSERAWKASGSRMFIEPRKPVTVEELIQGMIIQSGNDACIALAELVAGSEELFAQLMNKEAQRLGMKNTSFMNSTGLPDPKHFTTARDLATLASTLIRDFPEQYGKYYSMKEYRYNNITQQNRNRLLWLDPNVDGMKTGFTDNAGYCLIASAKRGSRRLLSVVLGTASDSMRAQESQKILNFGFQFYDSARLYEKGQTVSTIKVWKGSLSELNAGSLQGDITISVPRGSADKIKAEFVAMEPIVAPVSAGQRVGIVKVTLEGKPIAEYPVVALENIAVAGIFGRTWDSVRLWFK